jgi:hypothetical protein
MTLQAGRAVAFDDGARHVLHKLHMGTRVTRLLPNGQLTRVYVLHLLAAFLQSFTRRNAAWQHSK